MTFVFLLLTFFRTRNKLAALSLLLLVLHLSQYTVSKMAVCRKYIAPSGDALDCCNNKCNTKSPDCWAGFWPQMFWNVVGMAYDFIWTCVCFWRLTFVDSGWNLCHVGGEAIMASAQSSYRKCLWQFFANFYCGCPIQWKRADIDAWSIKKI